MDLGDEVEVWWILEFFSFHYGFWVLCEEVNLTDTLCI